MQRNKIENEKGKIKENKIMKIRLEKNDVKTIRLKKTKK